MLVLTPIAFVRPLGLDSFAVAAAIGCHREADDAGQVADFGVVRGVRGRDAAELGAPLACLIGPTADYVAATAVIAIGAWMLLHGESDNEEEKASRLVSAHTAQH
jgi:putative Mn2+ efflux pump MntP